MAPACLKAAEYASCEPASEPVWDDTAFAPASLRPALRITIGFLGLTFLANLDKSLPIPDGFHISSDHMRMLHLLPEIQ